MAASPIFVGTPKFAAVTTGLSANTALDGTGVLTTLATIGSSGGRLDTMYFTHLGTNVATALRVFVNDRLVHEETMAANTLSQVAASIQNVWRANMILPASATIKVTIGTAIASGVMVAAEYGEF